LDPRDKAPGCESSVGSMVIADPTFLSQLGSAGYTSMDELAMRTTGHPITDARTSFVRRLRCAGFDVHVKVYEYTSWKDRVRGIGRTTLFARSRASREAAAYEWLAARGFAAAQVRLVHERRSLGVLCRAVLVTDTLPGDSLATMLPRLDATSRRRCIEALVQFVSALHAAGFRDRNLDLRNLVASTPSAAGPGVFGGFRLWKIDSPRFRIRRPGLACDSLARRDWQRLARSLAEVGCQLPSGCEHLKLP
jgi:hypothetical protein